MNPRILAFALAAVVAAPAAAAPEPTGGEVLRLSDADRAALDAAAEKRALDATDDRPVAARKVHGTMEMMVGTGGRAGMALTMVAPLSDDGFVALGYLTEQGRYGHRFGRRH